MFESQIRSKRGNVRADEKAKAVGGDIGQRWEETKECGHMYRQNLNGSWDETVKKEKEQSWDFFTQL